MKNSKNKMDLTEQIKQTKSLIRLNNRNMYFNYFLCFWSAVFILWDMNSAYLSTRIPIFFFINSICALYMGYVFFKAIKSIKQNKEIKVALKSLLNAFVKLQNTYSDFIEKSANEIEIQ